MFNKAKSYSFSTLDFNAVTQIAARRCPDSVWGGDFLTPTSIT